MKKIFALLLCMTVTASLFAASFKVGQKLYVSKNAVLQNDKSKKIGTLEKGDVVIVVEAEKKRSKIQIDGKPSTTGWVKNKYLTTKKVVKSYSGKTVSGSIDELALSGKASKKGGSIQADESISITPAEGAASVEATTPAVVEEPIVEPIVEEVQPAAN